MSAADFIDRAERDILPVLPARAPDIARLRAIAAQDGLATVTVVGKYNHGKSRLLNELMGRDTFAVADRRETQALGEAVQGAVRWLDAPGLDADVAGADDDFAQQAAWLQSDVRLFVHSAKSGELDAQERRLLERLSADAQTTRRQTLLVVTQVDQMADDAELALVSAAIAAQAPGAALHPVSATRHRRGVEGGKKLLIEKSGIPALRAELGRALERVPAARACETARLCETIHRELHAVRVQRQDRLDHLLLRQTNERTRFDADLSTVFDKARDGLQHLLSGPGPDRALEPDTAADGFRLTVGRQERALVQVAYSKVCIQINAVLTRHGANELPVAQHTVAHSLNSVMVAVLGVSAKYRRDLRKMFFEDAGRAALIRDFTRYFELSADRVALAESAEQARVLVAEAERAQSAAAALQAQPAAG